MLKKYVLEIYQPGEKGFINACSLESDEPFLAIQKGDIINPSTWNLYCLDSLEAEYHQSNYGIVLKVTGVEHFLVQNEDGSVSQHKITVFVRVVENNQAALFGDPDSDTPQTPVS
jgi:hypothetical protein